MTGFKCRPSKGLKLIRDYRELLDRVRSFEEEQFANKKSSHQTPRLEPVNDTGGTMLLREVSQMVIRPLDHYMLPVLTEFWLCQKIGSLQDENQMLKDKIKSLERKLIEYTDGRGASKRGGDSPRRSSRYVS